jgi:phosphomannomutase
LDAEPDGTFPFGPPNPESKSMMRRTIKYCEQVGSVDLAILLDTDGDRCGIVLRNGETYKEVNRNRLIALCSQIILEKNEASTAKIVTDSVTSINLESFIALAGGSQVRFKKGYLNVINEAKVRRNG